MLDELLSHRLLILIGKGGVGKTTLSAALASLAARRNGATLAVECDEAAPLAALWEAPPSYAPRAVEPGLSVMVVEGRHALEEYLRLVIPRAIFSTVAATRLFQYFVLAAPGLRELMTLGKLYYEAELGHHGVRTWKTIVFDAPSTGHALNLLRMPFAARETFGDSRVGREAGHIAALLRNPRHCAALLVTTPESLALTETIEAYQELTRYQVAVQAVFLNRYSPARFAASDLTRFKKLAVLQGNSHLEYFTTVARTQVVRAAAARKALALLRAHTRFPIIELPDFGASAGHDLVVRTALHLSNQPAARAATVS